ncbi:MAG: tripartite tricarboxylate transporter substrate binding protein, partial [Betaproteobacteria bacterium]
MKRFHGFLLFFVLLSAGIALPARATWPDKSIRIVVAAPAGSSVDIVARLLAEGLRKSLAQAIVVDNKPGAGGTLAAAEVAKSPADGYTLFLGFNGPLANAPSLYAKLGYDPQRDFSPIILTGSQPNLLAVSASVPVKSTKELVVLAKSQPGQLTYASVGNGSVSHLCMELLKIQAGVDLLHVPFNGGPPAALAVAAGDVQVIFAAPSNLMALVASGKLRPLAVTSLARFAPLAAVPTIAEAGIPGLGQFEAIA